LYYVDTSAAAKVLLRERGSAAMREWAETHHDELCSSDILRVELQRAVRLHAPQLMAQARSLLQAILLTAVSTDLCERAARIEPPLLRTLDAIHLSTALEFGDDLQGLVTYDERLAEAAEANGIAVISPR
jgi:predicted nucleic acid-binding protein